LRESPATACSRYPRASSSEGPACPSMRRI
jgi:hypothetical protein